MGPLAAVSAVFALSLIGAIVLFKFLKSSAMINKSGYQAGGALAGFLLIFWVLDNSFEKYLSALEAGKPEAWTVVGKISEEGSRTHESVTVRLPPQPRCPVELTDKGGEFRLTVEDVPQFLEAEDAVLLEVYVEKEGYFPRAYPIKRASAEIDNAGKTIRLKETIEITAIPEDEPNQ